MIEPKRNPNPFIRMAQQAKDKKVEQLKQATVKSTDAPKKVAVPKITGGLTNKVAKKTGRGG